MIRAVTVENLETGETLPMYLQFPELSRGFAILGIDGLSPGQATVSVGDWATIDGGSVTYTHKSSRDIIFKMRFIETGDQRTVADIRRESYSYFPLKKPVRLTFRFIDANHVIRERYIDGIVKINEADIWSQEEGATITVVCADPYFKDTEVVRGNFAQLKDWFHFKFPDEDLDVGTYDVEFPVAEILRYKEKDIESLSTYDVGGILILKATGTVVNPGFYNRKTNTSMVLNYTMSKGERIKIDTRLGSKSIVSFDGSNRSMIQYLAPDSKWIVFGNGNNTIGLDADEGVEHLRCDYEIRQIYEGV